MKKFSFAVFVALSILVGENNSKTNCSVYQRWSRGNKARGQGQGHKKNPRPRQPFRGQTLSKPRIGMLEAKTMDQGHKRKCSPKKKKVFRKMFWAISKKRSSEKFFRRSPETTIFQKIFQSLHKLLTTSKIMLSSSRSQSNFRGLGFEAKAKDFKMCPRGRPPGQGHPQGLHLCCLHKLLINYHPKFFIKKKKQPL